MTTPTNSQTADFAKFDDDIAHGRTTSKPCEQVWFALPSEGIPEQRTRGALHTSTCGRMLKFVPNS